MTSKIYLNIENKTNFIFASLIISIFLIVFSSCKKEPTNQSDEGVDKNPLNGYIITPEGPMPSANVHFIEKGFHLSLQNGHVYKMNTKSGIKIEDFGEIHQINTKNLNSLNARLGISGVTGKAAIEQYDNKAPQLAGWITYAQWFNTSPQILNYFSTNLVVPASPINNDGQLIYIFEGLQDAVNGSDIMQPVLQWGHNNKFGSNSWCIANWYVWNGGGGTEAAYSGPELNIPSGTSLQAVISYTGQQPSGSFNYTSSFVGHSNSAMNITQGNPYNNYSASGSIAVPVVSKQAAAFETLEAYNNTGSPEVHGRYDYPAQPFVSMSNITLSVGNAPAALTWTPETAYANLGENTTIISNNSAGIGQVNLSFGNTVSVTATVPSTLNLHSVVMSITDPYGNLQNFTFGNGTSTKIYYPTVSQTSLNVAVATLIPPCHVTIIADGKQYTQDSPGGHGSVNFNNITIYSSLQISVVPF